MVEWVSTRAMPPEPTSSAGGGVTLGPLLSGAQGCLGNRVAVLLCTLTHPIRGQLDGVDEKWGEDSSPFAVQSAVEEGVHSGMFLIGF